MLPAHAGMIFFDYNDDETEEVTIIGSVVWYTIPFDFEI